MSPTVGQYFWKKSLSSTNRQLTKQREWRANPSYFSEKHHIGNGEPTEVIRLKRKKKKVELLPLFLLMQQQKEKTNRCLI